MKKRTIALLMAVVMLFGATVGGTIAWLQASTGEVVNTFTVGDINIDLKEHKYDATENELLEKVEANETTSVDNYKIIPGTDLPKDPFVRVKAGSEACWVFVKVETEKWPTSKVTFGIDGKWTVLDVTNYPDIYWYEQDTLVGETEDELLYILADDKVEVSEDLTKTEIEVIKAAGSPKLKFTAYAVQKENFATAKAAWDATFGATNP